MQQLGFVGWQIQYQYSAMYVCKPYKTTTAIKQKKRNQISFSSSSKDLYQATFDWTKGAIS